MASHPPNPAELEAPIPAVNPVSGSNLPHIPRSAVRDAVRVLTAAGCAVSSAEAWHLIKRWHERHRQDAADFVAGEDFVAHARRGDLLQVRSTKPRHEWRVKT